MSDPLVCHGQPVVRGLRYPVEMILELLASGISHEGILADSADLDSDDRIEVVRDRDFEVSHLVRQEPMRLL